MDLSSFKESTKQNDLPKGLSVHLQSLWYDKNGNWEKAHSLIDSLNDENSAFLHAYLHRKEGDKGNASYWYNRAGKPFPNISLDQEWESMAVFFLEKR